MQVAVFYSGGADSALLLHQAMKTHPKDDLTVIYVDFKCPKTNPKRDENLEFVMFEIAKHDLTLLVETVTPTGAKGPEGNARMAFKVVREWAEREFDIVYLGHNRDDHIETVMIQLFRGAGKGARGIPHYHHGKVYRPLLTYTRDEVRTKCKELWLKYFDDPSNEDTTMTRSFWRNKVLPLLKEHYGEGVYQRIDMISKKVG